MTNVVIIFKTNYCTNSKDCFNSPCGCIWSSSNIQTETCSGPSCFYWVAQDKVSYLMFQTNYVCACTHAHTPCHLFFSYFRFWLSIWAAHVGRENWFNNTLVMKRSPKSSCGWINTSMIGIKHISEYRIWKTRFNFPLCTDNPFNCLHKSWCSCSLRQDMWCDDNMSTAGWIKAKKFNQQGNTLSHYKVSL